MLAPLISLALLALAPARAQEGRFQAVVDHTGAVYVSSNYGLNWTEAPNTEIPFAALWEQVSISASGQYQEAVAWNTAMLRSVDYGATWSPVCVRVPGYFQECLTFLLVAMSTSGQHQTALTMLGIYTSSNYGVNWTLSANSPAPPGGLYNAVTVSPSGAHQAIICNAQLYTSSDYGRTWAKAAGPPCDLRTDLAISATGQFLAVACWVGPVYASFDFGNNWTAVLPTGGNAVAMSATGQYQLSGAFGLNISSDFGVTWAPSIPPTAPADVWYWAVSVSASGKYQTAVSDTLIFASSDYGRTWTRAAAPTPQESWRSIAISSGLSNSTEASGV